MQNYKYWSDKLASQELTEFTTNPEAMLWLKIHSITKKEVLDSFMEREGLDIKSKKVDDRAIEIYSSIDEQHVAEWNSKLDSFFNDKNAEQLAALDIGKLKLDLYRVQHFKWGGDQNNSLDKYFVTHYVKSILSYQDLQNKLATDALPVVSNYVVASWYNHWTSIIIEHIFKKHPSVLPTVGQIKSIDFIVKGVPFDLKVTYLPKWYQPNISQYLQSLRLPATELKGLKGIAKKYGVKHDSTIPENEQHAQILAQLKNVSDAAYNEAMTTLNSIRDKTVEYAITHKMELAKLLYENQGAMRFGSENRLYLVLIDKQDIQNSWEMKRDFNRLETEINKYLNSFETDDLSPLKVVFDYSGKRYTTHADVIFVIK